MANNVEARLEKRTVNEFLHTELQKVLDDEDDFEEEESNEENGKNCDNNEDDDEDEVEDEITRNISKRFVLANKNLIGKNQRTINNHEQSSSDENSDDTDQQACCNTKTQKSVRTNFKNEEPTPLFASRFSGSADKLLFEKPKTYFEYSKLPHLPANKTSQSASLSYYDKIDENSDETGSDIKEEKIKIPTVRPVYRNLTKINSSSLKLTAKLNPDDYFLSDDDDTDSSDEEYNNLSKTLGLPTASSRTCNAAANLKTINRILLPKQSNDSSELTSNSSTPSSTYPSMDLTTINTNYIIPLSENEQENVSSLNPSSRTADIQATEAEPTSTLSFRLSELSLEQPQQLQQSTVSLKENQTISTDTENTVQTPSVNQFLFKDKNNACKILEGLNELRLSKKMYDVTIIVSGERFECHKCVLASLSVYFNAMFTNELAESKQSEITMNSFEALTIKLIIDYAYTSQLNITDNNVQAVLTAANIFDIQTLKEACSRYMEWQMEDSNCIGILNFSDTHDCGELKKAAFKYITQNFTKVVIHEEFLGLNSAKLIEIISQDELNVPNEETVFKACLKWLKHQPDERLVTFYLILEKIRLPLINSYFLHDKVLAEPSIKSCSKCQALIQEALTYNLLKDRRNQIQNERTRSRQSFTHLEALVIIGGEDDSVVLRSVDAYFPLIDRWFPLQCSPYALSKHGTVSAEGSVLYMAGGEWPDQNPNETFWQFNSVLDEWKELNSLLTPRSELGLSIIDGYLYAVGGSNGFENLATVERYDSLMNTWKYCADMKYALTSPAVCSLNGLLYVIGGSLINEETEEQKVTDYFQVYNPDSDTWTELQRLKTARSGCGSCAVNSQIFLIGGWQSSSTFLNMVDCYDPSLERWETCPSMISMRHKPGVAVLNNRIYVCGGETLFNYYHDSIEAFDLGNRQWTFITLMNSGRSWLSCATLRLQSPLYDDCNETDASKVSASQKLFHFEKEVN